MKVLVSLHCSCRTGCLFLCCLSPKGVVKSVSTLRLIKHDAISNKYYICYSSDVFKKIRTSNSQWFLFLCTRISIRLFFISLWRLKKLMLIVEYVLYHNNNNNKTEQKQSKTSNFTLLIQPFKTTKFLSSLRVLSFWWKNVFILTIFSYKWKRREKKLSKSVTGLNLLFSWQIVSLFNYLKILLPFLLP